MTRYPALQLSPEEYELEVKKLLDALSVGLSNYTSFHREIVPGVDGDYEIDISVRFSALGANFLTLVECKRYKSPVSREKVLALHSKMQSVHAQKGIMFSTSSLQSGALEFAGAHGVAPVVFVDGRETWLKKSLDSDGLVPWSKVPGYVPRVAGQLVVGNTSHLLTADYTDGLLKFLKRG